MTRRDPLPVSVLTGFLGAGKTTILNRLLKLPQLSRAAVIINEFGEIGIDHLLVETADENIFEMASGCLCCTIRGDLVETLVRLIEKRDGGEIAAFDRVVIETTGLADPAPVLHTIMNHEYLLERYSLDGVIAVVDAVNGNATLDTQHEAVKQVAVADRIVLSKTDLLPETGDTTEQTTLAGRLRTLNPAAKIHHTGESDAELAQLLKNGLYDPATKTADVGRWLATDSYAAHGHHQHTHDVNRHGDNIRSFAVRSDKAISLWGFELFLELLRSYHGPNLLRVKAIVRLEDDETRPMIIHGVQHVFHPPVRLQNWPDEDHSSRLVFITRDIEQVEIEKLFEAFTDPVRGGADAFRDGTLSLRRN